MTPRITAADNDLAALAKLLRAEANECGETILLLPHGLSPIHHVEGSIPYGVRESQADPWEIKNALARIVPSRRAAS